MSIFKINEANLESIVNQFENNEEIIIETSLLRNEDKILLADILKIFLEEIGREDTFGYLHYCFIELLENANRANIKRAYFIAKNLDINNLNDYHKGMKDFNVTYQNYEHKYKEIFEKEKYYLRISFKVEDDIFIISVINNTPILDQELHVAREKIKEAKIFNSIEDVYSTVNNTDEKEGAGLGIIITILMLIKMGLTRSAFNIYKKENETISMIMLPLSLITLEKNQLVNDIIIKEIDDVPQFPNHITELLHLLNNEDVTFKEISRIVSNDPSLVAEILKFANSSLFMLQGKISSLTTAIQIIGIKKLKELLYSYGTMEVLNKRYDYTKMKKIWAHSYKVAFFAYQLARIHIPNENLEDTYIGGILHDIGRIILLGVNPELINKILYICHKKSIPVRIIEDILLGYNHTLIGASMAKKWNFPQKYIQVIHYHNSPLNCSDDYRNLVYCVYLANKMTLEQDQFEIYKDIYNSILYFFKIQNFNEYKNYVERLNEAFSKDSFNTNL